MRTPTTSMRTPAQPLSWPASQIPASRRMRRTFCGVTACSTLLALDLAGLPGASLYIGSWSEWCRNPKPRLPAN